MVKIINKSWTKLKAKILLSNPQCTYLFRMQRSLWCQWKFCTCNYAQFLPRSLNTRLCNWFLFGWVGEVDEKEILLQQALDYSAAATAHIPNAPPSQGAREQTRGSMKQWLLQPVPDLHPVATIELSSMPHVPILQILPSTLCNSSTASETSVVAEERAGFAQDCWIKTCSTDQRGEF